MMFQARIAGTGSYLPEKKLTNYDLEKIVDTKHEWIVERTGIHHRHIAADDQITSDLSLIASQRALETAGLGPEDLDMIILATVTWDQPMPSTACHLQAKLGCKNIFSFDLNAACSGFVYGSSIANQFIQTGTYKRILVVGAEILSRILNYQDRNTCILFGDGAGAAIYEAVEAKHPSIIHSSHTYADGRLSSLLELPAGGSKHPISTEMVQKGEHFMTMEGKEIFKNAVRTLTACCKEALETNNVSSDQVDWVVPHQANLRIIEAVSKQLRIPMDRFIVNIDHTGNTSAATIPIALDEAIKEGKIQRGQKVLLTAFGAGLTSGSMLLTY